MADAGRGRKFWRGEKLISIVGFPASKARDEDSGARDLLKECPQEKGNEGIRIGKGYKVSKDGAEEVTPQPVPVEALQYECTSCSPTRHWLSVASPPRGWCRALQPPTV